MVDCLFTVVVGSNLVAVTQTSDMAPASSKEFLDMQTTECGFTLKLGRDMIITYSQMNRADKNSQRSSIICAVWRNG